MLHLHTPHNFDLAIETLTNGGVIAAPTDTVYGLLADSTNDTAIRRVFQLKQRPLTKPLILLVSSIEMASQVAIFSQEAAALLYKLWIDSKYPVTVILNAQPSVSALVTAGGTTVAVRLPNNPLCLQLIQNLGSPVVAPSANISGEETSICYDDAVRYFGTLIPIIKGESSNMSSTILDLTSESPCILREGAVSREVLKEFL